MDNPIIEFFEAPVRAFKTKVAEDVEYARNTGPEGKSAGVAKSQNNSWFRGKGLANWLMSRNVATTTTTPIPEVVLNSQMTNGQLGNQNRPNRRRAVKRNNIRRVAGGQNVGNKNWNVRRNANANVQRRRVVQRPVDEDVAYSDEDDYEEFNGGRRYQVAYETIPYHSASYEEEEEDDDDGALIYAPVKAQGLRRVNGEQKQNAKPNNNYLQPFHDIPIQARPIRLRQNLPATKPIGNKQQQANKQQQVNKPQQANINKPMAGGIPNRNPANNLNRKKKKNKNKPGQMVNNADQLDPVHFIVHPQGNGQLPVLIPVNSNAPQNNKRPNVMYDSPAQDDYQSYQYIPVPVQSFGPSGGFKGIPQIQVIAQHTHTFRPHHGYPTEVIFGPAGYDNVYPGQNDNPQNNQNKRKPNRHKNETPINKQGQSQQIILATEDSLKSETPVSAMMEDLIEPTKQTIVVEEIMKPDAATATGDEIMEVSIADDKDTAAEVKSVDGRQHIVVPRHLFPIFGASSLVEVANNGRFLIKAGRDLKVADHEEGHVEEGPLKEILEIPQKSEEKPLLEDAPKKDELNPEEANSPAVEKEPEPELASPKPDSLLLSKPEAKPSPVEKVLPEKIPIRPEQLQDIPVTIIHDEPPIQKPAHSEKTGRAVEHGARKPILRSEVVHEKANGHFIVKSGVAPAVQSRNNGDHAATVKETSSEITNIKVKAIDNSRAL